MESETKGASKVENFKKFVRKHPGLIKKVKDEKLTWQNIFEEWELLGEEDPQWNSYKKKDTEEGTKQENKGTGGKEKKASKSTISLAQIFEMLKKVDLNELQGHVSQFSQTVENVQQMLKQFQNNSGDNNNSGGNRPNQQQQRRPYPYPQQPYPQQQQNPYYNNYQGNQFGGNQQ